MDNNNSIPYGSISWDNEDSFAPTNQQREPRGIPPLRPATLPSSNGLRYSLRGPHFPPPQQRNQAVGISRNLELPSLQRGVTPQSSFQQPSSSSASSAPYERYFTLRPSRSTSHVQMHSMEPQSSNCVNSTTEGQSYATLYANPSPGSSSGNPTLSSVSENPDFSTPSVYNENACNNNIEMSQGLLREGSYERFHGSRAKRKSSSSNDEGQDGPSTKQFLSEERMAARMHNLRISSDHNYPVNIIQRFMDSFNEASKSSQSQINDDDDEFENADDMQRRIRDIGGIQRTLKDMTMKIVLYLSIATLCIAVSSGRKHCLGAGQRGKRAANPGAAIATGGWERRFGTQGTSWNDCYSHCRNSCQSTAGSWSSCMSFDVKREHIDNGPFAADKTKCSCWGYSDGEPALQSASYTSVDGGLGYRHYGPCEVV